MDMFFRNTRPPNESKMVGDRNPYLPNTPGGCGNGWATSNATTSVGLVPFGGNMGGSMAADGCSVDTNSTLLWGDPNTSRMKGPKQTFARPFATTPFMGGGDPNAVDTETHVQFGHSTANRKSIQTVSDKPFPVFEPLIRERVDDIPENNYFIEPFLRGGLASRLVPKTRVELGH